MPLAAMLALAACTADVRLDAGSMLTCASEAECPSGWTCRSQAGRCVPVGSENVPPSVRSGSVEITPPVAGPGAQVRAVFELDEELAVPPEVRLGERALVLETQDGRRWTFSHRVTGTEDEGPAPVVLSAVDRSGNLARDVSLGTVLLDFTAPRITEVTAERGAVARAGGTLVVRVGVDDPAVSRPEVALVGGGGFEHVESQGAVHRFSYVAAGSEAETPYAVRVRVTDAAGNASERSVEGLVAFDFTAPAVVAGTPRFLANPVQKGATAGVAFSVGEPLAALPRVVMRAEGAGGREFEWRNVSLVGLEVAASQPLSGVEDGTYQVLAEGLRDAAGNVLASHPLGTLVVDSSPPVVGGLELDRRQVRRGQPLEIAFTANELLGADPVVTVGGAAAERAPSADGRYRYLFTPGAADAEGLATVVVSLRDAAGNAGAGIETVELDFTPPALASTQAAPSVVKLGDDLVWSLQVTEPLGGDGLPSVSISRDGVALPGIFPAVPLVRTSTGFAWRVAGPDLADGAYAVELSLTDVAGNDSGPVAGAGFTVDRTPPVVSALAPDRARVRAGDPLSIDFVVSEPLAEPPVVTVGGRPADPAQAPDAAHPGWTYRLTPDAARDAEGPATVVVAVRDLAGNTADALATVELDFTPPSVASSQAAPATVKLGDELVWSIQVTEPLGGDGLPLLTVLRDGVEIPGFLAAPLTRTATGFTWSKSGPELDDGAYAVSVSLVDRAGNASGMLAAAPFVVDRTRPAVTALSTSRRKARHGASVTIAFAVSEAVSNTPVVTVSGRAATLAESPGEASEGRWLYAFTPDEALDREGLAEVAITVADPAGNTASATTRLELDFTPPAIAATQAAPATVKLGDDLVWSLQATEPLGVDGLPRLTVSRDGVGLQGFFGAPLAATATGFTWRKLGAELVDGSYEITASLEDEAGNGAATLEAAGFSVDRAQPRILDFVAAPSRVRSGEPLRVRFGVSEPIVGMPSATVNGATAACVGAGSLRFVCEYVADEIRDAEGPATALVAVQDLAGNTTSSTAVVELDFTAPRVGSAVVAYAAPADNPLGIVQAAGAGTRILVTAIASEPLDPTLVPTLSFSLGGVPLGPPVPASAHDAGSASFDVPVPAASPDGTYVPAIRWRDVAGNLAADAAFAAPAVRIKASRPVLAVDQSKVTYLRSPWGNAAPEVLGGVTIPAGPYFALAPADPLSPAPTLPGDTFRIDGTAPARVRIWTDHERSSLLGTLTPDGAGGWPRVRLANLDTAAVWASALDEAGNESEPVRIENAEWVATPTGAAPGAGPHAVAGLTWAREVFSTGAAADIPATVSAADGSAMLAAAAAAWHRRPAAGATPQARGWHAMTYDAGRGRVVLFGGSVEPRETCDVAGTHICSDTWEWDGYAWADVSPATSPPGRSGHAMAYDAARGRVVLFGGRGHSRGACGSSGTSCADTWEWDGTTWSERTPAAGPSARSDTALTYDAVRGRIVLFGGGVFDGFSPIRYRDTWEWDGKAWTERFPALRPPARSGHGLAYDAGRGRTVLFGGSSGSPRLSDTWEWDGSAWLERTAVTAPPARQGHAMAYDPRRRAVMLFGGDGTGCRTNPAGFCRDTWEWDGAGWSRRVPPAQPKERGFHALTFDALRGRMVLFGGMGADNSVDACGTSGGRYCRDTWEWDGASWSERPSGEEPPPAPASPAPTMAVAYDAARGRMVHFVGSATWERIGGSWVLADPTASPPTRSSHALAYDAARARVVLFGGLGACGSSASTPCGDTWTWDGVTWTQATPGTAPPARYDHALAYDAARERVVLFGGYGATAGTCGAVGHRQCSDTWEWDGATWRESRPAAAPAARSGHAMAYDEARQRTVLFGGDAAEAAACDGFSPRCSDTWEWDGATWTPIRPVVGPVGRVKPAMAYDPSRGRVVLYGGSGPALRRCNNPSNLVCADTWEWDGATWRERKTSIGPTGLLSVALTYDSAQRALLLLRGGTDTWEWSPPASLQPAIQWTASATSAGFAGDSVTGLRVRAHCGGGFSPNGPSDKGAVLHGWATGGPGTFGGTWLPLATNDAGLLAAAPWLSPPPTALIDWSASDAEEARRFVLARDVKLSFQCRPGAPSGTDGDRVAMDYVEVRVRYAAQ
jgi:hypothetical protein